MTKRQATPEQKEQAAARRAAFRDLCAKVAAMSDAQRAAFAEKILVTTVEGRPLSAGNNVLIAFQLGNATLVGGFRQWKTMGRTVKKGEHGLMIWCPTGQRGERTETAPDGATETITTGPEKPGFILGYVFDISQTEEAVK